jgi:hypothetical protein
VAGRIAQNNAGAEEADAGEDALHYAADRVRVGGEMAVGHSNDESGGRGRAERDEGMSSKSRRFSMQLAIQAEQRADDQGGAQTQGGLFISA